MASWYSNAGPGADVFIAAMIRRWELSLADRDTSVLAHPAIAYLGDQGGWSALAEQIPILGFGADDMASTAEGSAVSGTEIGGDHPTVTPTPYSLAREISDLARALDGIGSAAWENFVMDATTAWQRTLLNLVCALFPSCVASKGTTGTALTVATLKSAVNALQQAYVPGPYLAVLHGRQWEHVSTDGLALGGAFAQSPEAPQYLRGTGAYMGRFFDGSLDIFVSGQIDTVNVGVDYCGGVFGRGFMGWKTASSQPSPAANVLWAEGPLLVEVRRGEIATGGSAGLNKMTLGDTVVSSVNMGAGILQNAGGVKVISKVAA